jgi:hypothetical protein
VITHEMVLTGHGESGAEEWHCPQCGRRMLVRWLPSFDKVVVEHGDERAAHVGGKGGVRMTPGTGPAAEPRPSGSERSWLRENGIDWGPEPA